MTLESLELSSSQYDGVQVHVKKEIEKALQAQHTNETIYLHNGEDITRIFYSECNNGYMYDTYNDSLENIEAGEAESIDGGLCTGTLYDAIGMA